MQLGLYLQLRLKFEIPDLKSGGVALRLVSEEPINDKWDKSQMLKWFPADCLHRTDFYGMIQ